MVGDWSGRYQLSFNDETIVDATLTANVVPTGEPFSIIAEENGIQLIAVPQPSPGDDLAATKIQVRAVDPTEAIAGISSLSLANVHQVSVELADI